MDGLKATLSVLEMRHVLALRVLVRKLPPVHPELAAWIDHAVTWEECRRRGASGALLPPSPVMGPQGTKAAVKALESIRGRLVESVQVRLFLAAVKTELEMHPNAPASLKTR